MWLARGFLLVGIAIFGGLAAVSATSSLASYGYLRQVALTSDVTLHVGPCTATEVQLAIDVRGDGWAALAVGTTMRDADAVIGEESTVKAYSLTGYGRSFVAENPDVTSRLSDTYVLRSGGRTQVLFKRPLDTGVKTVSCTGNVGLLWALGASRDLTSTAHTQRSSFSVNLATLSVTEDNTVRDHKVVHGILMMAGWGFMLPLGTLAAVWGGPRFQLLGPNAFKTHRAVQVVGLAIALVGVVYALGNIYKKTAGMPTHGVLGLIVMSIGVLQPLNAVLRPHGDDSMKRRLWELLHKNSGRVATVLGLVNCIIGASLAKDQHSTDSGFNVMLVLSAVFTGCFVVAFMAGQIWVHRPHTMDKEEAGSQGGPRRMATE